MQAKPFVNRLKSQRGLTIIEFMISIVLGMILVAALAVLIANQSANRAEVDRSGRMIENGRYAIQTMVEDLQMAGYWGELADPIKAPTSVTSLGTVPGTLPDPCSVALNSPEDAASPGLREQTLLHIQGYDGSTFAGLSCVSNWKSGTDVLVVRRLEADFSDVLTGGVTDLTKLRPGQAYVQTGLLSASGSTPLNIMNTGSNTATFTALRRDGNKAPPRKLVVHIYYVASCDVCTGADADTIPTLKRVELGVASSGTPAPAMGLPVTIAEGIENLQFDYGVDDDPGTPAKPLDGAPDGVDVNPTDIARLGTTADKWQNAVSVTIYLLSRSTEKTPNFSDTKSYCMGTSYPGPSSCYTPPADVAGYQKHLFTQTVRMTNPSQRRSS